MNREIQLARRNPKSVPYSSTSTSRRSDRPGSLACFDIAFGEHDAIRPTAMLPIDRTDATPARRNPTSGTSSIVDLGDDPAGRRAEPGEIDARGLAHQAAATVTTDEVLRPQRRPARQRDVDTVVVRSDVDHLGAPADRDTELTEDPVGEDALEVASATVRARSCGASGKSLMSSGVDDEPHRGTLLAGVDEPFRDAALVEDLDGARVESARLVIRRRPGRRVVRRRRRRSPPTPARPPTSARSDRRLRSPPNARSSQAGGVPPP